MPAAVPDYLQNQDFRSASPAMRFGPYFAIWNQNWTKPKDTKADVLKKIGVLNPDDKDRLSALVERQKTLASTYQPEILLTIEALAIAPFTTGLGNEHPLENGFAFLNPYGLPYLPASGVKGVLRQASRELASGDWGDSKGWSKEQRFTLKAGKQEITLSLSDVLFGKETGDGDQNHVRGVLNFWDVVPQIKGDALQVEIMTPHQKHYYQDGQSPHDSGQPTPICFLTVPPGSAFNFHVTCDLHRLKLLAPELLNRHQWKSLLQAAFEHAFNWLGFGAKTAVGYGAFVEDPEAQKRREKQESRLAADAEEKARTERLAQLSPEDQQWEIAQEVIAVFRAEFVAVKSAGPFNPGQGTFSQARLDFIKQALEWQESRSRRAAADLLAESATKEWGRPGKKERWQEIQTAIAALSGNS
ncbi:MAG: type III-B CRISPR module RAMP protein Cmr6 [Pseudohongiella sp.]|nr:type III-B CRISPR module RAMP protein Cmr6 [Pseudohongiella sp.]